MENRWRHQVREHVERRDNMGRHTRMEAVISFLCNARAHNNIKKKKNPTSEKNHPLRLICSNEINVMAIRQ